MSVANYKQQGWKRSDADWYVEPPWTVERLLLCDDIAAALGGVAAIWDPACGQGTIPGVARRLGFATVASDLHDRGCPGAVRHDFAQCGPGVLTFAPQPLEAAGHDARRTAIVCNPPFGLAERFLERAIAIEAPLVCLLLRLAFLEGRERWAGIYKATPPARVLVLVDRASMPPGRLLAEGKIKAAGGFIAFAWFCWARQSDGSYAGDARLGWLA